MPSSDPAKAVIPAALPLRTRAWYFALTTLLLGVILWLNAHYLFESRLYESGDLAANSLSVVRAEHFHEIYGAYSRWEFHHPGPALFYALGLGEVLLYRTFHLVPTPYNAQVVVVLLLNAGFLAAGIGVAARWVRGQLFVPLALLLAVVHFTSVDPRFCLLTPWTAYVLPMPFFALMMAAASVGAGRGQDLPLLLLAGCFTIHLNVAQPLFVGPFFLLAYFGLWWSRGSVQPALVPRSKFPWMLHPSALLRAWRAFPRSHAVAAGIAVVFVLPIVVDWLLVSPSNVSRILLHIQSHQGGPRHAWLDSLFCFLRYGVYRPSHGSSDISPGGVTPGQIAAYLLGHPEMTLLWTGALAAPVLAVVLRRWFTPDPTIERTTHRLSQSAETPVGRWRFLGSLSFFWAVSAALAVVWNHLQDGEMFYFNSWFAYAIYYVLALLAAGAVCDIVEAQAARLRHPGRWRTAIAMLCGAATIAYGTRHLGSYRAVDYDTREERAGATTVNAALTERSGAPRAKLLVFPHAGWGVAAGIAALLSHEGQPCFVPADWHVMFGEDHVPADLPSALLSKSGEAAYDVWQIVPANTINADLAAAHPLTEGFALLTDGPGLDPAGAGATITFGGRPSAAFKYAIFGWLDPDDPAITSVWSEGKIGVIRFRPTKVPPGSEVRIEFRFSTVYLPVGVRATQHLGVRFNGHDLGTLELSATGPATLSVMIPADVWNERPTAWFALAFPDAISPLAAGESDDGNALAFATERIAFRLLPPPD